MTDVNVTVPPEQTVIKRPSPEQVERLNPALAPRTELYVTCFTNYLEEIIKASSGTPNGLLDQKTIDSLFVFYVSGMLEVMTPGSTFNTKYNFFNNLMTPPAQGATP